MPITRLKVWFSPVTRHVALKKKNKYTYISGHRPPQLRINEERQTDNFDCRQYLSRGIRKHKTELSGKQE